MHACILPEQAVPEMVYTVSGGTLNPTHSHSLILVQILTTCSMEIKLNYRRLPSVEKSEILIEL